MFFTLSRTKTIILASFVVCSCFEFGPVQKETWNQQKKKIVQYLTIPLSNDQEWVTKGKSACLTHYHTIPTFDDLRKKPLENIEGKGENAGDQHFLLFPQCFLLFTKQISNFQSLLFCCLQMLSIWTSPKYCRLVMS